MTRAHGRRRCRRKTTSPIASRRMRVDPSSVSHPEWVCLPDRGRFRRIAPAGDTADLGSRGHHLHGIVIPVHTTLKLVSPARRPRITMRFVWPVMDVSISVYLLWPIKRLGRPS